MQAEVLPGGETPAGSPGSSAAAGNGAAAGTGTSARPPGPDARVGASTAEPRLARLTEPGCCTEPFWSADGNSVLFIDRPTTSTPTGIWAVDVAGAARGPRLVTEDIGYYSADMTYRIELQGDTTTIVRLADGRRWNVPAGGRPVAISPDSGRVAWQEAPPNTPYERRTSRIWTAALDGGDPREIAALPRGSLWGWLTDDKLLVRGRDVLAAREDVLWALSARDGTRSEIARGERMRGELPSPGGSWLAYYVSQQTEPAVTGIWLVSAAGGAPRRLDKALFGAYRWRDDRRLLIVPMRVGAEHHEIVEVDAETLAARPLTAAATTPFKIANGDWAVSPGGDRIAFVESRDKSIWVLELPPIAESP